MKTISISQWMAAGIKTLVRDSNLNPNGAANLLGLMERGSVSRSICESSGPAGLSSRVQRGKAAAGRRPALRFCRIGATAIVVLFTAFLFSTSARAQINLPIGNFFPGEKVTITFDVTIASPFPAGAASVTNQGIVSGSNFTTINSDDPTTGPVGDATVTPVFVPPLITSATNATFTVGVNGVFNVLRTGVPTPDLFISGTIPNNVGFNPGTGDLSGTPIVGTGGAYPLVITATNVSGTNVQNFTLTVLESPALTCPSNVTTSQCAQVAFSATVTRGYPPPVVTYKLGTNVITSLYSFPVGTNTVTVTATNGVPTDKTCSFTVTVVGLAEQPLLTILPSGTNVVVCWSNIFSCYTLQYAAQLQATNVWTNYTGPLGASGGNIYATNPISTSNLFFRLKY